ncbi:hypothetical protein EDB85DRAFT_331713 [Lactarius pseudohatsudake]|nr:hypothetical protein EDB85DRAFT_331713 [Lactarius pseudohatsudake]
MSTQTTSRLPLSPTSSDDSDDDYFPYTAQRPNTSEHKLAVSNHPVITRPPRLSDGDILPKAVRNFENHCQNYFINAKGGVADDEKVARILSCFENCLVNDWIVEDRGRLINLTFEQFMAEFRTTWLPLHWERDLSVQVLSARFDPKRISFGAWANQVQVLNVDLRGTPSHLDEHRMRNQLNANMDEDLRSLAREAKTNQITELHEWVARVGDLDDHRRDREKRMREAVDQMIRARKSKR